MNSINKLSVKKYKIIGFMIFVFCLFILINKIDFQEYKNAPYLDNPGLNLYYLTQLSGIYLYYYIILILVLPNILGYDFVRIKNNKASYFIISRLGKKKFERLKTLSIYISSFVFCLISNIIILLFIHFFHYPITFNTLSPEIYSYTTLFSTNELISLIVYVIFSSIGCGVFSLFLYSISVFIKNQYIFRCSGLLFGIALYMIPPFIGLKFGLNSFIYNLTALAFIPNLITPGMAGTGVYQQITPVQGFIISLLFFGILTFILYSYKSIKESVYE